MRQREMMSREAADHIVLMTGNEAMARGALEAGVAIGTGYPGTPSSEILENLSVAAEQHALYVEWSANEKVAFETAFGSAMTGLRSLVTMKHEGGNVMLDSLSKMVYTGVKGGFLIISCDDPGALSSSNEQDNRIFAQFVDMPVFEPSSPQEAKDMVMQGFAISETYSLPIMIRSVTRLSHGKSTVELGPCGSRKVKPFFDRHDGIQDRWFCCAFNHLEKHRHHHTVMERFRNEYIPTSSFNQVAGAEHNTWGIITSGIAYNFVMESVHSLVLSDSVSVLKLGMPYPLDDALCINFLRRREKVLVIEESDPFVERQIRVLAQINAIQTSIHGQLTGYLDRPGEMTFERVTAAIEKAFRPPCNNTRRTRENQAEIDSCIRKRPLTMCSGCPHRGTHMAFMKALKAIRIEKPIIFGDIGCYELGHEPPFDDMDSIYNMGAGVGLANGIAHSGVTNPVIALIGDSTLLHSGLPGFTNATHHKANITMIVFDNATIAMTGHQAPVNSTRTLMGEEGRGVDIALMLKAAGAAYVVESDAFNIAETQRAIQEAILYQGPSAVIVHGPCALEDDRVKRKTGSAITPCIINEDDCIGCRICTDQFGCPALQWDETSQKVGIDVFICNGCGVCIQICPNDAFGRNEEKQ